MKNPPGEFLWSTIREALSDTVWAIFFVALVSSFVGAAVEAAATRDFFPGYLFLWVYHWCVSGIMIWGILMVLVHIWALHRLLATDHDALQSLLIVVINQAVVSTVIVVIAYGGPDMRRGLAAGLIIIGLAVAGLCRCRQAKL